MKIAVFGLGYVGTVNMVCFARLGHRVVGIDVKREKVHAINDGVPPVREPQVTEMLQDGIASGMITAAVDPGDALSETDAVFICVGTPSESQGAVDTAALSNVVHEIAQTCRRQRCSPTIFVRSTVPPGTTETIVARTMDSVLEGHQQVDVVFYPEFLREGAAVGDFFAPARTVVGTKDGRPNQVARELLENEHLGKTHFTDYRTAEFIKYTDNAFHALKAVFVNEIYSLGASYGVNTAAANELFLMDDKLNVSGRYLRGGAPIGGSCLGKDLRALQHLASDIAFEIPLLSAILPSNEQLQQRLFANVARFASRRVLVAGLTFKDHTDDLRESPMVRLVDTLLFDHACARLAIYDEDLDLNGLRITNPALYPLVTDDLDGAMSRAEVVVAFKRYAADVAERVRPDQVFINAEDPIAYSQAVQESRDKDAAPRRAA